MKQSLLWVGIDLDSVLMNCLCTDGKNRYFTIGSGSRLEILYFPCQRLA